LGVILGLSLFGVSLNGSRVGGFGCGVGFGCGCGVGFGCGCVGFCGVDLLISSILLKMTVTSSSLV
jgi:hypothetical protein